MRMFYSKIVIVLGELDLRLRFYLLGCKTTAFFANNFHFIMTHFFKISISRSLLTLKFGYAAGIWHQNMLCGGN
jgi:hypothetical protein